MTVQTLAIVVLLVSFFVMIFLRFPIAYAVGLSSVLCLMVQGQALTDVCRLMVKGISSFSLMAVPFFITMGVLMGSGGISEKLIALADASGAVLFNSSHASPRQYKVLPGMMHPPFCLFSKTNYSIHPSGRLCKWRA